MQVGFAILDDLGHTGYGATGAYPRHEGIDVALGVGPNFLGRGAAMDLRIGRVVELLWHKPLVAVLPKQFFCPSDGSFHALGAGSKNNLGPKHAKQNAPLLGHGLGHGKQATISLGGADEGQGDPGVS